MKKLFLCALSTFALVSCNLFSPVKEVVGEDGKVRSVLSPHARIEYFGNGVYFFHHTDEEFSRVLSVFLAEHPELEIVTISASKTSYTHVVVFKEKTSE